MNTYKDEFTRGYLFAVGTLLRQHDEPSMAYDMLKDIGILTRKDLTRVAQEADLDPQELARIQRDLANEWRP